MEMVLQKSTMNISGQRRVQVENSVLDTNIISGLICGLVLWVLVWQVHIFCHNALQAMCTGTSSYMVLSDCWKMRLL